ncbi:MAG: sulfite exporter TauE/SafE family protein [Pseudomonadota bacterium]
MFDLPTLAAIVCAFLIAGTVKGVIGLGLPTVSLGLLILFIDLRAAMALLLIPAFATNVWQAAVGGNGWAIMRRLWPFFVMTTVTVWIGVALLTRINLAVLATLLGVLLIAYAALNLAGARLAVNYRQETWVGVLAGTTNGVLTGMTGSSVVPGVLYLQSVGLPRDTLIQAMGLLFTATTFALAVSMQGHGLLSINLGLLSGISLLPAIAGMVLGRWVRQQLSEVLFRRVFFLALLALGIFIAVRAIAGAG